MSDEAMDVASSFLRWVEAADRIRATSKRLEKLAVLEAYLPTLDDAALPIAARFFSSAEISRQPESIDAATDCDGRPQR